MWIPQFFKHCIDTEHCPAIASPVPEGPPLNWCGLRPSRFLPPSLVLGAPVTEGALSLPLCEACSPVEKTAGKI